MFTKTPLTKFTSNCHHAKENVVNFGCRQNVKHENGEKGKRLRLVNSFISILTTLHAVKWFDVLSSSAETKEF